MRRVTRRAWRPPPSRDGTPREATDYRSLSLWHDTAGDDWVPRDPLPGDLRADVAVVGAGLTGLWAAYYLLRADPSLRVVVVEKETAGFGASGRLGGYASGLAPAWRARFAALPNVGEPGAGALHAALLGSVDEVARVTAAEGIEAHLREAGRITLARSRVQLRAARSDVELAGDLGDLLLLTAVEARKRVGASRLWGATYSPGWASLHPVRLVRGLAEVVEASAGGAVYEQTTVTSLRPRRVRTDRGTVTAEVVVRATGGYTAALPGHRRRLAPVPVHAIATEPLPGVLWGALGLAEGEAFADYRHHTVHGLRTHDGRLVLEGHRAPYRFGSRVRPDLDRDPRAFAALWAALREIFPLLEGTAVTHAWGGVVGVPRDGIPSVGLDRESGVAWADVSAGGAAASNLAGRTLADLVLGRRTGLPGLAWVGHRSPTWPREPARWASVTAGLRAPRLADREERLLRHPSRVAAMTTPVLGDR